MITFEFEKTYPQTYSVIISLLKKGLTANLFWKSLIESSW